MTVIDAQIERIRDKLTRVRAAGISTFGAGSHRYELGPPLPEERVRAFEIEHGVTLPDGYRAFITQLGHGGVGQYGGAGPYYGLYALSEWDEFVDWIADGAPADWIGRPSPLRPGENELPDVDRDVADEDWPPEELMAMYGGVMTLGTRGCTYMTGLVVTGEARGRVVYLDAQHDEPPYVGRDEGFLDWYERWLDELLAGYESSWFGYGPAGDEATLLKIIATSDDAALTREALSNLHKLAELTDDVWDVVGSAVDHDAASVRAAAVRLMQKSPRTGDVDIIASRWEDEDADVRRAVIRGVMALDPEPWDERIWATLREDQQLREEAFASLHQAKMLTQERLLSIVEDDTLADLRVRAMQKVEWGLEHAELLNELLFDDDPNTRRETTYATARAGLTLPSDLLVKALETEVEDHAQSVLMRLAVEAEDRSAVPRMLEIAAEGNDFHRLDAVRALAELGEERLAPIAEEMLALDRVPRTGGRSHTRTIAALVRESLEKSPSPKLRALGKVV